MREESQASEATGNTVDMKDDGPMIVAAVRLANCEPGCALAAFTDRAVLAQWWRGELTSDLTPAGRYGVFFAAIPARLTGQVVSYEPGNSLEFSWAWDGEQADSTVTVRVAPTGDGATVLTIEHGPHTDDEAGRTAHTEHWDGWEFFLPRLSAALSDQTDV